jgi:hypothetical protein
LTSLPRPSQVGVVLDGPVLGALSSEVKDAVQRVSATARERLAAYLQKQQALGLNPDPAELARLRQQTREELAGVLTPPQLEEYLLRYSQNANDLRSEIAGLKYFRTTADEFRALFRAVDPYDQRLELLAGKTDPASVAQRNALVQERENAIKAALGSDRYRQFVLLQDPNYQQAYAAAQDAGDSTAAQTLYEINAATQDQLSRIRSNTNLTAQQAEIERRRAELEKAKADALALGQEIPPEPQSVPTNPPVQPRPIPSHIYVLGSGESATTVAARYNISLRDMQAANPGVELRRLRAGDVLRIPDGIAW